MSENTFSYTFFPAFWETNWPAGENLHIKNPILKHVNNFNFMG